MSGVGVSRPRVFRFGPFVLDERSGDLRHDERVVRLQGKPLAALVTLLEHPGDVVGREMLRARLWPEGEHVDAEQGIANALLKVREALQDSARSPRWIETLPRRGYRWLGPVACVDPGATRSDPTPLRGSDWRYVAVPAVLVLLILGVVGSGRFLSMPRGVPADPEVAETYGRARHLLALKTPDALAASAAAFSEVTLTAPDFAPAWAGLAQATHFLGAVNVLSWDDARSRTRAAAERALALDPRVAEAHAVIGESVFRFGAGGDDPAPHFVRALVLDPDAGYIHQWFGNYLADAGQMPDALDHLERARALDPLSAHVAVDLAGLYFETGRRADARALLDRTFELHPHYPKAHFLAGRISQVEGRTADAVAAFERLLQLSPETPKFLEALAAAYADAGRPDDASRVMEALRRLGDRRPLPPGLLARAEARVTGR